jgi:CRP-like cAMP-binding protein
VDRLNEQVVARLALRGDVLLTSTVIGGRYAIRLCVLNHTSGPTDIAHALDRVATEDVAVAVGEGSVTSFERGPTQAGVAIDWLTGHDMTAEDLRRMPAFAAVTDDQAGRFLATGRDETYAIGDAVTERWALARTFYVVRSGGLSVRVADREVNTLRPGDHLGEISAIDWGRDFSYGRTATVIATEPSHLLAFPAAALRELMLDNPAIDRAVRRIAQARLGAR